MEPVTVFRFSINKKVFQPLMDTNCQEIMLEVLKYTDGDKTEYSVQAKPNYGAEAAILEVEASTLCPKPCPANLFPAGGI